MNISRIRPLPIVLIFCVSVLSLSTSCGQEQKEKQQERETGTSDTSETELLVAEEGKKFLIDWLENHDEKNIVTDEEGVGLQNNPTRIKALLYESKNSDGGYIVETEFRIKMADGRTIIEFLAGTGETEAEAVNDTLLNFTLSTFHVAYKAFMNPDDPHQPTSELTINGKQRTIVAGDVMTRSNMENPMDEFDLTEHMKKLIAELPLDDRAHWLKVVYGQASGKVIAISVTLDNNGHDELTRMAGALPWPETTDDFYLTKQFLVIQPVDPGSDKTQDKKSDRE